MSRGGRVDRTWRRYRPRSVRSRLVATYTVVALVLAAGGFGVFAVLLHRGLNASLDVSLQARVAPLADSVAGLAAGGSVDTAPSGPDAGTQASGDPDHDRLGVDSFSVVYRPDGGIAQIEPTTLRVSPLLPIQVAQARRASTYFTIGAEESELRVLGTPVAGPGGTWVVAVGSNLDTVTDAANRAIGELLLTLPFLILVAAVGAWLLSGAALRPVERLRSDAARLGANDPQSRLRVPETADELARLADTFNGLLDRLQRSVTRQRDLVADAGHELRTPLAVLRTELDLADRPNRSRTDLADSITHARSEVDRLCQLAEDLLFLARADEHAALLALSATDLSEVLSDAVRAARGGADRAGVILVSDIPERLPARADPSALRRAIDNLVANALRATPPGGTVTVAASRDEGATTISVADSGPGFPADFLPHAFERFRRPDGSRTAITGGAGLGLAIVAEIARAHLGSVQATNRPGGGAVITLALPPLPATDSDPPSVRETATSS
jgi:two-component system, OmpR family, sensor kinase